MEGLLREAPARAAALRGREDPPTAPHPTPRSEGDAPAPRRSLATALLTSAGPAGCSLVAEVKRRSPSAGSLREDLEPAHLARAYAAAGAAAISVLTEPTRFGGSLADLERAAAAVDVPVLRKDFLVDPLQVRESRDAGADAVLLIARLLEGPRLSELLAAARECGLEALVEVHAPGELETALAAGAEVVGVNNRDLSTLATDVRHSLEVARGARERGIRWPRVAISESGIRTAAQVRELASAGYHAVLVGETLLRALDPGAAVGALLGRSDS